MESAALRQLESIAGYPGVSLVAGLPDLHGGRTPVGLAVVSRNHIYPYLIGGDIGCGMGLFRTAVPLRKFKLEKWESRLNGLQGFHQISIENPFAADCPGADFGTIGGGNHFLEFQRVEEIMEAESFAALKAPESEVLLLAHTGSRGFGQRIMNEFNSETGYETDDPRAGSYLELHAQALLWARRNRFMAAAKIMGWLGLSHPPETLTDCAHNYLEQQEDLFIHRKGAVSTQNGLVVIPGSRGSLTYLVKPAAETSQSAWSLSHGAGRKWARSLCQSRLNKKYDRQSISRTALKSRVVCHDLGLLFQEAPEAYKNIGEVIAALKEHGLIEVVATLRPLLTFKG
jgi:release factor H-coupled RctB family protein